jgi:hypothetical protein
MKAVNVPENCHLPHRSGEYEQARFVGFDPPQQAVDDSVRARARVTQHKISVTARTRCMT